MIYREFNLLNRWFSQSIASIIDSKTKIENKCSDAITGEKKTKVGLIAHKMADSIAIR
jgi:hypothetical protein